MQAGVHPEQPARTISRAQVHDGFEQLLLGFYQQSRRVGVHAGVCLCHASRLIYIIEYDSGDWRARAMNTFDHAMQQCLVRPDG